jgi:hypothetical protein
MPKNLKRLTGYGDLHFITFCCYQRRVAQMAVVVVGVIHVGGIRVRLLRQPVQLVVSVGSKSAFL